MKRYPVFALIALLFLLLVLLGSWVYLNNYPWPIGDDTDKTAEGDRSRDGREASGDLLDDAADGQEPGADGRAGTGKGGPLEAPPEPFRRANPPDPIETGGKVKDAETTGDKTGDTVVAELTPGLAAIRDGSGNEGDLEPFIVSTLLPGSMRLGQKPETRVMKDIPVSMRSGVLGKKEHKPEEPIDGFAEMLVGQLIWPALSEDVDTEVREAGRRQAVVYLDRLPEFRAIVDADEGWFSLPMTKRMQDDYRAKGLRLVVHSPAFEISGGYEAIEVKKEDGAIKINLQVAPVISVVVDVSPANAVEAGVRVWLERRGQPNSPDADDSLYMSAKVPSTGRLVFSVPEHYGEFRVAATGESWHSGLPQVVRLRDWKTNKVSVKLELAAANCDHVTGRVSYGDDDYPIPGARLESTHFANTVYTGEAGTFDMWVPFDTYQTLRQFHCTATGYRPEILPLEGRAEGTDGVVGDGPIGPFKVKMADTVVVELNLPKEAARMSYVQIAELSSIKPLKARDVVHGVEVPWGIERLTLKEYDGEGGTLSVCIDAEQWEDIFRLYASGKALSAKLTAKTVEDVYRKR
ncbi:MAG: hypothetical protein H6839_08315 [Planctomycetes bacterium]|nr:hypothetical protein [Planctomycetota bacterium]